jgi:hypothetical protein
MPVTSTPLTERRRIDLTMALGRIAAVLAIIAFGGLFWAINGGFSVLGLETLAKSFNTSGRLFWAIISRWTFSVPDVPGLPATQPIIPWLGVVAASLLQFVTIYRKLRHLAIPRWMFAAALVLSLYDLATTYYGLGTVAWLAGAGLIVQGLVAAVLTFIVELSASILLKEVSK